jgi:hypothetical protein
MTLFGNSKMIGILMIDVRQLMFSNTLVAPDLHETELTTLLPTISGQWSA